MTEAQIIFAASDSGLTYYGMGKDRAKFLHHLEAFAALVAAHEREECAKLADDWDKANKLSNYGAFISKRIRARGTT